jgi:hypothetical protein
MPCCISSLLTMTVLGSTVCEWLQCLAIFLVCLSRLSATVWQRRSRACVWCGGAVIVLYPWTVFHFDLSLDYFTYLRSVLAESCCTHTLVNSTLTRVYFAPVRATYIAALYSAFWLNTCVVYTVNLSLRSPANPEVRYPLPFASRLVYSCLDSILRLSR